MLTIAGGVALSLSKFCSAIKPPKLEPSLHDANSMAALGAAALAYSASRIASTSSPLVPGLVQLFVPVGGAGCTCVNEPEAKFESPRVERKVVQSAVAYTLVSSITTTVWPCPETPLLNSGFKL